MKIEKVFDEIELFTSIGIFSQHCSVFENVEVFFVSDAPFFADPTMKVSIPAGSTNVTLDCGADLEAFPEPTFQWSGSEETTAHLVYEIGNQSQSSFHRVACTAFNAYGSATKFFNITEGKANFSLWEVQLTSRYSAAHTHTPSSLTPIAA